MTVPRLSTRLLLGPEDVPPSRDDFEVVGVFNPGAVRAGDEVVLLVRGRAAPGAAAGVHRPAAVGPGRRVDGRLGSRRGAGAGRSAGGPRKADGLVRLTFTSHLRVVRCGDGRAVREVTGVTFCPQTEVEEFGVEDPRITPLGGRSTSPTWPCRGTARRRPWRTADFRTFERHGVIFCPENKDVVLFPEKSAGPTRWPHRPVCGTPFTRPEMWVARSPDLIHWGAHAPCRLGRRVAIRPGGGRAAAGPRPGGWLAIYHGNRQPTRPGEVGAYYAAILLDPDDPARVLRRSPEPSSARGRLRGRGVRAERRLPDRGRRGALLVYYGPPTPSRRSPSSPSGSCSTRWTAPD